MNAGTLEKVREALQVLGEASARMAAADDAANENAAFAAGRSVVLDAQKLVDERKGGAS